MLEPEFPEYLSWDIEKLRKEYFKVNLEKTAVSIRMSENMEILGAAVDLIEAFEKLRVRVKNIN